MTTATMNRSAAKPLSTPNVYADAPHSKAVMRQTQVLIGVALLGGVAAAYFVNMAWALATVVIGAGLVYAGASGSCLMASLIARAPWNVAVEAKHQKSHGGCGGGGCG